jgi:uncharacterized membrane protein
LKVKKIVLIALFIAISAILSNFKIFSTVAFDSMPAFLAATLISPIAGGLVGALGHMLTAYTSGFPFTVPIHIFIAVLMFIIVSIYGVLFKKFNKYIAIIIAILLNGPIATLVSGYVIDLFNHTHSAISFYKVMVLPLTFVSVANIILAFILQRVLKRARIEI